MIERLARIGVGPLVLAGFFLPWAHGPSVLAQESYSGFELVGFAGRLQALDLGFSASAALWSVRLLILGVAIAAAWHTVLAPAARWHFVYPLSGWYLGIAGGVAAGIGIWRAGIEQPPLGLGLWLAGGALFVACEVAARRRSPGASVSEYTMPAQQNRPGRADQLPPTRSEEPPVTDRQALANDPVAARSHAP
jgi:hypothetical protein